MTEPRQGALEAPCGIPIRAFRPTSWRKLVRLGFAAKTTRARGRRAMQKRQPIALAAVAFLPKSAAAKLFTRPRLGSWRGGSRPSSRLSRLGCNLMPEVADLVRP